MQHTPGHSQAAGKMFEILEASLAEVKHTNRWRRVLPARKSGKGQHHPRAIDRPAFEAPTIPMSPAETTIVSASEQRIEWQREAGTDRERQTGRETEIDRGKRETGREGEGEGESESQENWLKEGRATEEDHVNEDSKNEEGSIGRAWILLERAGVTFKNSHDDPV